MSTETLDIVFAMPHPDDVEITCGGAIAKFVSLGYKVGIVHITNGEPTPRGTPETRTAETAAAAEILGVAKVITLPLTNRELMDGPPARYAVATVLRRYKAPIVVSMAGRTPGASPDHYQAELIVEGARFYSQLTKWDDRFDNTPPHRVDWQWYRPIGFSALQFPWPATFVVDISSVYEKKLAAIACYKSQFDQERLKKLMHRLRAQDAAEGGRVGAEYGELFALPHPVNLSDPVKHFQQIHMPMSAAHYPPRAM
jgi:bacillithiol biosynthesis deacetylase BshB1